MPVLLCQTLREVDQKPSSREQPAANLSVDLAVDLADLLGRSDLPVTKVEDVCPHGIIMPPKTFEQ